MEDNKEISEENETAIKGKKNPQPMQQDGQVLIYDDNGKLKERVFYKNGKKNGEACVYKNGLIAEKKNYIDDLLEGFVEIYDQGIMKMYVKYANNIPNGIGYFFHKSGIVNAIAWYKNGLFEGPFLVFNETGLLVKRDTYMANKLNGPSYIYYENGIIFESGQYKDNLKEEKWINKTPDGKLIQTIIYNAGAIVAKKVEKRD